MPHHHSSQVELVEEFARLDIHRAERTGVPEAIFAEGKTDGQVVSLVRSMVEKAGVALATRVTGECAKALSESLGSKFRISYNQLGRTFLAKNHKHIPKSSGGKIAIFAAGTADLPVAEEAKVTAETMGCDVTACYDVGIAGIHRLMEPLKLILEKEVSAVVVVAGMEGALPSVVRGLVPMPVIGVPVSTGYGYGGKGEGALMTMLQSCAPGLTVVNIDNGFGAGATAALIANQVASAKGQRKG